MKLGDYKRIEEIDFGALYRSHKALSGDRIKSAKEWDKRAEKMGEKMAGGGLYNDFIKSKVDLSGAQTMLEIGCGAGTFSLAFAPYLETIYAFDFSGEMLKILKRLQKEKGLTNIVSFQADIEGDWAIAPKCDIVLASRCMEVTDMKSVLTQIDNYAKRAVYITAKVGKSFLHNELLEALERKVVGRPDYIYILNILFEMGIYAKVDFAPIGDPQNDPPTTKAAFIEAIAGMSDNLSKEEEKRAADYFDRCLSEGKTPRFRNDSWALISYEKPL
ncbi:MAG: class I SAM-dependent methyltransferase [Helicobacteraceae bacterium]|nr:class I SAM-dependent methyltransferase [Helicobacteraceae bacterium]